MVSLHILAPGRHAPSQFGPGFFFCLLICNLAHVILIDPAYACGVYLPCDTDHGWKFRYSAACLAPTVKFCSSLKTPGYSQFLELDRRIRTFPLPSHLQSPLDESPEGWADDPSLAMQQYGVVCERESSKQFGGIRQFGSSADRSFQIYCTFTGLTS